MIYVSWGLASSQQWTHCSCSGWSCCAGRCGTPPPSWYHQAPRTCPSPSRVPPHSKGSPGQPKETKKGLTPNQHTRAMQRQSPSWNAKAHPNQIWNQRSHVYWGPRPKASCPSRGGRRSGVLQAVGSRGPCSGSLQLQCSSWPASRSAGGDPNRHEWR